MEDESKFWLRLWLLPTVVVLTAIIGAYVTNIMWHARYADLIKNSSTPIVLRCAVDPPAPSQIAYAMMCIEATRHN